MGVSSKSAVSAASAAAADAIATATVGSAAAAEPAVSYPVPATRCTHQSQLASYSMRPGDGNQLKCCGCGNTFTATARRAYCQCCHNYYHTYCLGRGSIRSTCNTCSTPISIAVMRCPHVSKLSEFNLQAGGKITDMCSGCGKIFGDKSTKRRCRCCYNYYHEHCASYLFGGIIPGTCLSCVTWLLASPAAGSVIAGPAATAGSAAPAGSVAAAEPVSHSVPATRCTHQVQLAVHRMEPGGRNTENCSGCGKIFTAAALKARVRCVCCLNYYHYACSSKKIIATSPKSTCVSCAPWTLPSIAAAGPVIAGPAAAAGSATHAVSAAAASLAAHAGSAATAGSVAPAAPAVSPVPATRCTHVSKLAVFGLHPKMVFVKKPRCSGCNHLLVLGAQTMRCQCCENYYHDLDRCRNPENLMRCATCT